MLCYLGTFYCCVILMLFSSACKCPEGSEIASLTFEAESFVKCRTEGIILQRLLDQKYIIKHTDESTGKNSIGRILI